MSVAGQMADTSRDFNDMGVSAFCERLSSLVTKPDSDADYRARQKAVWDKMDAGIARVWAKNDAEVI